MLREEMAELPRVTRIRLDSPEQVIFSMSIITNYDIGDMTLRTFNGTSILRIRYLKHAYIREDQLKKLNKDYILTKKDENKPIIEGKRIDLVSEFKSDSHRLYLVRDIPQTHP